MSWRALIVAAVVVSVCALPRADQNPSPVLVQEIVSEGYPAEVHQVTTEDGYILALHRIPYGIDGPSTERRPVVFLMHGLMGSSKNFVFQGKENGIGYNLVDAGFDVWLGNARGNAYSRAHVSLNPDHFRQKHDFFDFTWEQIAMIDVAAMVDYALAVTGEEKVHYIGHSQGGTSFLVLNSMRPEYNEKFASAHLLAGVGYKNNFPNSQLRAAAQLTNSLYSLGTTLGLVEIKNLDDLPINVRSQTNRATDFCFGDIAYKEFCNMLGLRNIVGERSDTDVDIGVGGSSLKQFAHYGQNIRDRAFRRWDYGLLTNRRVYGSTTPPSYDLSLITVPTIMHYTVGDVLLDERDVLAMASAMPRATVRRIARDSFSHVDFIAADDVREQVTNYIVERLSASS